MLRRSFILAQYDPPGNYYLFSDVLPEEKQLRQQLQQKKLVGDLLGMLSKDCMCPVSPF